MAFRYLAGGASPDHWTLNAFRQRHTKGRNDLFTRVVELARASGLGWLGHVAIDSTRLAANASRNRIDTEQALRNARANSAGHSPLTEATRYGRSERRRGQ